MLQTKFAILLALSFFFSKVHAAWWDSWTPWGKTEPAPTIVIGYVRVTAEEAERFNEEKKPYVKEPVDDKFGEGLYIRQVTDYRYQGEDKVDAQNEVEKTWFCAIKANEPEVKSIGKLFIPLSIWTEEDASERVDDFVRQWIPEEPDTEPLRFSWMEDASPVMQMLIPKSVVKDNKLGLWAQCFESEAKLKELSKEFLNWPRMWEIQGLVTEYKGKQRTIG
ncbi:hypothetical protein LZ554_005466 [Drepanopeziza brunnea f. sp. 'monogermtubi']|nr:hypothetical protein LZ554_005466 [Drepanopeziza brunnea f. sp. 'monogermtubi']